MTRSFLTLLVLLTAACSASPDARNTCEPLATVTLCAPDLAPADLAFSKSAWGATEDCEDPSAIRVVIEELDYGHVGEAGIQERAVYLDPSAWSHSSGAGATLAHEIGHILGYEHTDGACDIMSPTQPSRLCAALEIAGCSFVGAP